ncbi:hypothetical protein ACFWFI_15710, partial [Streptomyces sp. NPDC060209]
MSPLPGAPRGNAPPTGPHGTPPHQARHVLAALLLAVLTLLGGAPATAVTALPERGHAAAQAAGPSTQAAGPSARPAGPSTGVSGRAAHGLDRAAHVSGPRSVARPAPVLRPEAVPVPGPRAG